MKKYTFLIFHKEYNEFLGKLQNLGVLHVIEKASGESVNQELHEQYRQVQEYSQVIKSLEKRKIGTQGTQLQENDGSELLHKIRMLNTNLEQLDQQIQALRKERFQLEPWGEFDWNAISELARSGIQIRFFSGSLKKFNELKESGLHLELIHDSGGTAYYILLERSGEKQIVDADEIHLPSKSLSEILADEKKLQSDIDGINSELDKYAASGIGILKDARDKLLEKISFKQVELHTSKEAENKLMVLEGWVPDDKKKDINSFLEKENVYYEVSEPVSEDKIPIKLTNKKFFKLFEPIGDLYSLPNYFEFDLTPLFAPFFLLFFGLCLGDTGYGIVLLLAASLAKLKIKKPNSLRPYLTLGQWLGLSTILMGLVSGTFFGISLLDTGYLLTNESMNFMRTLNVPSSITEQVSGLIGTHFETQGSYLKSISKVIGEESMKEYRSELIRSAFSDVRILNYFRHLMLDSNQMFTLAIGIGLVQIFFGMCVKAFNIAYHRGFKYAISTLGWIFLFAGLAVVFYLSGKNVIPQESKKTVLYILIGISGFMILVFSDPDSNPLVSSLKGIWDVYGMLSGVFGDTLSYIRLFALGTSSAILGLVFNIIGMQILDIPYAGPLLFVVFMLFGHGLNIAMATLGAFVHPIRLTFVEFYKNAGFSGGGKAYKPFK